MEPVRWGILGTGNIANQFTTGLSVLDDAELVAVGSRSVASANRFGDTYGVARRHGSYEALANDPEVELVYIATPHVYHLENSLLCLEAGKGVLCEKPFAINATEAGRMLDMARQRQLFMMEAVWTRFLPHMEQIVDLIAGGAIGEVRMIQANFAFQTPFDRSSRLFDPALGGGSLLDVGIYPVFLAHLFLGAPAEIRTLAHLGKSGVDELAGIVLGYESGALAVLTSAIRASLPHTAAIAGDRGHIVIHERWWAPGGFTLQRDGHEEEHFEPVVKGNGYNYEAAEAGRCWRSGLIESPKVPHASTLAVMQTLDAIRSAWGLRYPVEA